MFSSSIPLLCIPLHDSFSCVRSFGCRPCASQFPSSPPIYLPSSFLPDDSPSLSLLSLPSPPRPIVSLLPASLPLLPWCITLPFSSVNLTWPVCLRFESVLLWFPFPSPQCSFAPPLLFLLFIYIENDGGRAVRLDWRMARGHGWGDLGVWWTLLSVRILLKELAGSLL